MILDARRLDASIASGILPDAAGARRLVGACARDAWPRRGGWPRLAALQPRVQRSQKGRLLQRCRLQGPVATPQAPVADEKFWGAVVTAAISAAPGIYQAVRGKEFQPGY